MNPRLLLIETSGRSGQVALAEGDALLAARRLDEARHQARDLAPAVADLLAAIGWKPRDIAAIVVSRGPGSYTGLRVGIMSAKTFAYAAGSHFSPLIPSLSSPRSADRGPAPRHYRRCAAAEGLSPGFERGVPLSPLAIRPVEQWLAEGPAAWVSGPAFACIVKAAAGSVSSLTNRSGSRSVEPADIGPETLAGRRAGRPFAVEPLYLRPSSAEEQWQARGRRVQRGTFFAHTFAMGRFSPHSFSERSRHNGGSTKSRRQETGRDQPEPAAAPEQCFVGQPVQGQIRRRGAGVEP